MPPFLPHNPGKRKQDSTSFEAKADTKRQAVHRDAESHSNNTLANASRCELCWMVQWRKPQYKKHKTWDGDGVLVVKDCKAELYNSDGKIISFGKVPVAFSQENVFSIGDKEVEFDRVLPTEEYLSGACFTSYNSFDQTALPTVTKINGYKYKPLMPSDRGAKINPTPNAIQSRLILRDIARPMSTNIEQYHWKANLYELETASRVGQRTAYVSLLGNKVTIISEGKCIRTIAWEGEELRRGLSFCVDTEEVELTDPVEASQIPRLNNTVVTVARTRRLSTAKQNPLASKRHREFKPLHDTNAPGAIIMKSPHDNREERVTKQDPTVIPVVLDPILAGRMRPHQIEGVKFMYESVMGLRRHEGHGCILADEMGLGKSLQTIGLIWTMLKQNPYAELSPLAKKVLLVCPVTLVKNWRAEFHKWLGRDRINIAVCDKDVQVAQIFSNVRTQQVIITGYERLRAITKYLSVGVPPIDLIICDEGHRLRSLNGKTRETFRVFRTQRRVILSGTPIQNDLREFHAMVDFCNPGLFGDYSTFRRAYEVPILRGRAPDASLDNVNVGKLRSGQLHAISKSFVLRRDIRVLGGKLPPKHEYVVFVSPTSLQLALYASILQPERIEDFVQSSRSESLPIINMLVKISNSPVLLKATFDSSRARIPDGSDADARHQVLALLPRKTDIGDVSLSGKLTALSKLLHLIHQATDEKCVIVSHYTSTLNILEVYCQRNNYSFLRLDGNTAASKRQELVTEFNKCSREKCFVFLLSSKAGGVGLNLTGASRLCLIDCDWNPSHDLQAMARCHRDGQTRSVIIYRLLTTGTIDEKIYQRQVTKLGLSGSLIGDTSKSRNDTFTRNDLRDIFRVHPDTTCNTHDLLGCTCNGLGVVTQEAVTDISLPREKPIQHPVMSFITASQVKPEPSMSRDLSLTTLQEWKHFDTSQVAVELPLADEILSMLISAQNQRPSISSVKCMQGGDISYIFEKSTVDAEAMEST
ncbi:hypothetical protein AX15_004671 [Amanita polypyramis BW_CC]|nr:hypothetical protein AX15_004671 [Amanita polypyramis BW_CC]